MEVKLEGLTKVFMDRKGKKTVAVNNLNLVIPSGKLIGLLGPSGCGKSTTLYMIAGLHKPTGGRIYFGEKDVTNVPPERREIGLVFQNYALYPHLTVRQNIMFPLENKKVPKSEAFERALEIAKLVGIDQLLDRKPKELSGGQQQRVAIARALVKRPAVLLLDEPLSNLDARLRLQTREEIRRIQRETGITTIFVTHDQEEAMSISDEIVVMKLGLVQQVAYPQDVYDDPSNQFVAQFLGSPAINIFNGELKEGKLYINGKLADSGYDASGEYDYHSPELYNRLVLDGYDGSAEEYADAVDRAMSSENPEDYLVEAVIAKGYRKDREGIRETIDNLRTFERKNRHVNIGVRPEGFVLNEKGTIPVHVDFVEHIGRDVSIVGKIREQDRNVRIIISSDFRNETTANELTFSAKKFFVFEKDGTRIK